jgi:hypothetical protein
MENRESVKQELIEQRIGDAFALSIALQSPGVGIVDDDELSKVLRYALVLMGVKAENWPVPEEKTILLAHIKKYYSKHTLREVCLAFELAINGTLELSRNEITCYENFSCQYFSKIMNAYRRWAAPRANEIGRLVPTLALPPENADDFFSEWWTEFVAQVKGGGLRVEFVPMSLYAWKEKRGDLEALKRERFDLLLQKAVDRRLAQLTLAVNQGLNKALKKLLDEFLQMKESGEFSGENAAYIKRLAKQMLLFEVAYKQ